MSDPIPKQASEIVTELKATALTEAERFDAQVEVNETKQGWSEVGARIIGDKLHAMLFGEEAASIQKAHMDLASRRAKLEAREEDRRQIGFQYQKLINKRAALLARLAHGNEQVADMQAQIDHNFAVLAGCIGEPVTSDTYAPNVARELTTTISAHALMELSFDKLKSEITDSETEIKAFVKTYHVAETFVPEGLR